MGDGIWTLNRSTFPAPHTTTTPSTTDHPGTLRQDGPPRPQLEEPLVTKSIGATAGHLAAPGSTPIHSGGYANDVPSYVYVLTYVAVRRSQAYRQKTETPNSHSFRTSPALKTRIPAAIVSTSPGEFFAASSACGCEFSYKGW